MPIVGIRRIGFHPANFRSVKKLAFCFHDVKYLRRYFVYTPRIDGFSSVIFSEAMVIRKPKKRRPALGKITIQLRVQPETRRAVSQLRASDWVQRRPRNAAYPSTSLRCGLPKQRNLASLIGGEREFPTIFKRSSETLFWNSRVRIVGPRGAEPLPKRTSVALAGLNTVSGRRYKIRKRGTESLEWYPFSKLWSAALGIYFSQPPESSQALTWQR